MKTRQEIEKIDKLIAKEMTPLRNRHYTYCLLVSELLAFYEDARETNHFYEVFCRIFDYGFIKGMRYYKKYGGKRRDS